MAEASGIRIARMSEPHLREVFSLIERENWGWEYSEIRQIHSLDPGSSVVAVDGKDVVGLVTCIDFGSLAFIIHVIVKDGWRGKGLGTRMMEQVLSGLDSRSVPLVELHANPEAVEFYDQFSFKRVEAVSFWAKEPPHGCGAASRRGAAPVARPELDINGASEMLASSTGYVVGDIARALVAAPPDDVVCRMREGRATALLISRSGHDLYGAGPWLMERPTAVEAESMMRELLSRLSPKRIDLLVPESNATAEAALRSCGFSTLKKGIVRVARSSGQVEAFPESLLAVGHVGLV